LKDEKKARSAKELLLKEQQARLKKTKEELLNLQKEESKLNQTVREAERTKATLSKELDAEKKQS